MSTAVFVGYSTQGSFSNDGLWVLKAGSVAIGAGVGGTDCGIFGGAKPYKLSGIPEIPAFYKLTAPSNTTSGNPYTITFSVRSNNWKSYELWAMSYEHQATSYKTTSSLTYWFTRFLKMIFLRHCEEWRESLVKGRRSNLRHVVCFVKPTHISLQFHSQWRSVAVFAAL